MRDSHLIALAGITLLAAALRFPTLDAQSFWLDETVTATLLDQGLAGALADVPDSESTPPLYYALAWLWSRPFGLGEVGLRSLSALAGVATVPVVYAAGATLLSRRAGLIAAALIAVNPLLVWYSQEARSYALLVLLSALSLLFFARALPREEAATRGAQARAGAGASAPAGGSPRALAGWAVFSALALATHYFALFLVLPEAAWLLWRSRRGALAPVAAVGAVGAAGLALLPLALHQTSNDRAGFIADSSLGVRLAQVPKQLLVGFDAPVEALLVALAGAAALGGAALLAVRADARQRRRARVPAAVAAAAVGAPVLLAVAGADFLITRNLLPAAAPLALALAAGLATRGAGRAGAVAAGTYAAVAVAAVLAVVAEPRFQRDDWRGAAAALGPAQRDRGITITPPEGVIPMRYYLPSASAMPPPGAPVGEVDVVGLALRRPGEGLSPPRNDPRLTPPAMELFHRLEAPTFTLLRYRGAQPVPLTAAGLQGVRLDESVSGTVLFQPAGES